MGGFVRTKNGLVRLNDVQQHLLFFFCLTPVVTSRGSWPRKEYIDVIAGGGLDLSCIQTKPSRSSIVFFSNKAKSHYPKFWGNVVRPSIPILPPPPITQNSLLTDSCGPRSKVDVAFINYRASIMMTGRKPSSGWLGLGRGGGGYRACIINEASRRSLFCDIKRPCPSLMFDTQG
jgi:hypothetical protein